MDTTENETTKEHLGTSTQADPIGEKVLEVVRDTLDYCSGGEDGGVLPILEITRETRFKEDLLCDQLDLVEVIMTVEEAFPPVFISEEQTERIRTVADLIAAVKEAQEKGQRY